VEQRFVQTELEFANEQDGRDGLLRASLFSGPGVTAAPPSLGLGSAPDSGEQPRFGRNRAESRRQGLARQPLCGRCFLGRITVGSASAVVAT
jgi:hypothetical protein